ncbi:unnamed protein product [Pleuronectes platessa]|uniref:Uncharacterized protein n=1 Tax=Pleuronectes platessa TaxID=8262 RepID=A0A9N7UVI4_PLEPL|nr:unnamed protein product [Pleuronectes platessa]
MFTREGPGCGSPLLNACLLLTNDKTLLHMMQRPDSTNQRSGPSQTPPTALPVYGDGAAGGLNHDATSSSSLGPTDFAKI